MFIRKAVCMCINQYHINLACLIKSPDSYEFMNVYMTHFKVSKFQLKYLHLYYEDEWKSCRFGTACRWVNDDRFFIFGFLNTLKTTFQWINHINHNNPQQLITKPQGRTLYVCVCMCLDLHELERSLKVLNGVHLDSEELHAHDEADDALHHMRTLLL